MRPRPDHPPHRHRGTGRPGVSAPPSPRSARTMRPAAGSLRAPSPRTSLTPRTPPASTCPAAYGSSTTRPARVRATPHPRVVRRPADPRLRRDSGRQRRSASRPPSASAGLKRSACSAKCSCAAPWPALAARGSSDRAAGPPRSRRPRARARRDRSRRRSRAARRRRGGRAPGRRPPRLAGAPAVGLGERVCVSPHARNKWARTDRVAGTPPQRRQQPNLLWARTSPVGARSYQRAARRESVPRPGRTTARDCAGRPPRRAAERASRATRAGIARQILTGVEAHRSGGSRPPASPVAPLRILARRGGRARVRTASPGGAGAMGASRAAPGAPADAVPPRRGASAPLRMGGDGGRRCVSGCQRECAAQMAVSRRRSPRRSEQRAESRVGLGAARLGPHPPRRPGVSGAPAPGLGVRQPGGAAGGLGSATGRVAQASAAAHAPRQLGARDLGPCEGAAAAGALPHPSDLAPTQRLIGCTRAGKWRNHGAMAEPPARGLRAGGDRRDDTFGCSPRPLPDPPRCETEGKRDGWKNPHGSTRLTGSVALLAAIAWTAAPACADALYLLVDGVAAARRNRSAKGRLPLITFTFSVDDSTENAPQADHRPGKPADAHERARLRRRGALIPPGAAQGGAGFRSCPRWTRQRQGAPRRLRAVVVKGLGQALGSRDASTAFSLATSIRFPLRRQRTPPPRAGTRRGARPESGRTPASPPPRLRRDRVTRSRTATRSPGAAHRDDAWRFLSRRSSRSGRPVMREAVMPNGWPIEIKRRSG
jgi:hypothetical protein